MALVYYKTAWKDGHCLFNGEVLPTDETDVEVWRSSRDIRVKWNRLVRPLQGKCWDQVKVVFFVLRRYLLLSFKLRNKCPNVRQNLNSELISLVEILLRREAETDTSWSSC